MAGVKQSFAGVGPIEYFAIVSNQYASFPPGLEHLTRNGDEETFVEYRNSDSTHDPQLPPTINRERGNIPASGSSLRWSGDSSENAAGFISQGASVASTAGSQGTSRVHSIGGLTVTHRFPRQLQTVEGLAFPDRALCWNLHQAMKAAKPSNPLEASNTRRSLSQSYVSPQLHSPYVARSNVDPTNQSPAGLPRVHCFSFVDPNTFDFVYCTALAYTPKSSGLTTVAPQQSEFQHWQHDSGGTRRRPPSPPIFNPPMSSGQSFIGLSPQHKQHSPVGKRILCLLSREPVFGFSRDVLNNIYEILEVLEAKSNVHVSSELRTFLHGVISSLVNPRLRLQHALGNGTSSVCQLHWQLSRDKSRVFTALLPWCRTRGIPNVEISSIAELFKRISGEALVQVVEHLFAEGSIVVVSPESNELCALSFAILSLLFPLRWSGTFLPVLPKPLFGALNCSDSPHEPYFFGIQGLSIQEVKMEIQSRWKSEENHVTSTRRGDEYLQRVKARAKATGSPYGTPVPERFPESPAVPVSTPVLGHSSSSSSLSAPTTPSGNAPVTFFDSGTAQSSSPALNVANSPVLIVDLRSGMVERVKCVKVAGAQHVPSGVSNNNHVADGITPKRTNSAPSLAALRTPTRSLHAVGDPGSADLVALKLPAYVRCRLVKLVEAYVTEGAKSNSADSKCIQKHDPGKVCSACGFKESNTWALRCRVAFVEAFTSIFHDYKQFRIPLNLADCSGGFDAVGFLRSAVMVSQGGLVPVMVQYSNMFHEFILESFEPPNKCQMSNAAKFDEIVDTLHGKLKRKSTKGKRSRMENAVRRILGTMGYSHAAATLVVSKLLLLDEKDLKNLFNSVDRFEEVLRQLNIPKTTPGEDAAAAVSPDSPTKFENTKADTLAFMDDERTNRLVHAIVCHSEDAPLLDVIGAHEGAPLISVGKFMETREDRRANGTSSALLGYQCAGRTSFALDRLTSVKALFRKNRSVDFLTKRDWTQSSFGTVDEGEVFVDEDPTIRALQWSRAHEKKRQSHQSELFSNSVSVLCSDLSNKVKSEQKARRKALNALERREASLMEMSFKVSRSGEVNAPPSLSQLNREELEDLVMRLLRSNPSLGQEAVLQGTTVSLPRNKSDRSSSTWQVGGGNAHTTPNLMPQHSSDGSVQMTPRSVVGSNHHEEGSAETPSSTNVILQATPNSTRRNLTHEQFQVTPSSIRRGTDLLHTTPGSLVGNSRLDRKSVPNLTERELQRADYSQSTPNSVAQRRYTTDHSQTTPSTKAKASHTEPSRTTRSSGKFTEKTSKSSSNSQGLRIELPTDPTSTPVAMTTNDVPDSRLSDSPIRRVRSAMQMRPPKLDIDSGSQELTSRSASNSPSSAAPGTGSKKREFFPREVKRYSPLYADSTKNASPLGRSFSPAPAPLVPKIKGDHHPTSPSPLKRSITEPTKQGQTSSPIAMAQGTSVNTVPTSGNEHTTSRLPRRPLTHSGISATSEANNFERRRNSGSVSPLPQQQSDAGNSTERVATVPTLIAQGNAKLGGGRQPIGSKARSLHGSERLPNQDNVPNTSTSQQDSSLVKNFEKNTHHQDTHLPNHTFPTPGTPSPTDQIDELEAVIEV